VAVNAESPQNLKEEGFIDYVDNFNISGAQQSDGGERLGEGSK